MDKIYDIIIIGAGPAGLSAAIYAKRGGLDVLVIESAVYGGKLTKTYEIENYPGIQKIAGIELAEKLKEHALSFNTEIINSEVIKIASLNNLKTVTLSNNDIYTSKYLIIASGTKERTLELEKANDFVGRGISYCAVCDGFFYRNKEIIIIGGGNSALEEALYLSSLVSKITIVVRKDVLRAEKNIIDKVNNNPKISIIYKHLPNELIIDDNRIVGLKLIDVNSNETLNINCSGIFPYIGADPCTNFVSKEILDENAYIKVNEDMSTSIEGIYAAGDCTKKNLRQVITACNDGAIAANSIIKKLKE